MALNWAMLSPDRSPVPLPDEMVIRTINSPGAEVVVGIPGPSPGAPSKKLTGSGGLWLTDQRVCHVSSSMARSTLTGLSAHIRIRSLLRHPRFRLVIRPLDRHPHVQI